MAIEYLGDGGPDGTVMGKSATEKLGFYGLTTAIVRPSISSVGTTTATTTLNELRITRLTAAFLALGLITSA